MNVGLQASTRRGRLEIRKQVAEMLGKKKHVSVDTFLEVENM